LVRSKGLVATFGLHTGPASCLHIAAGALAGFFGRRDICSLPLNKIVALFFYRAARAYSAKRHGLSLTTFSERGPTEFERVEPDTVRDEVISFFDQPTMLNPRDSTRASYCAQYIDFPEPHPAPEFNEIGLIVLGAAATALERYANHLTTNTTGVDVGDEFNSIFGFDRGKVGWSFPTKDVSILG
jgi:hypothetical protein